MKLTIKLYSAVIILMTPVMISCKKCESCYLIEEIGGTKVESSVGQICGDKIQEKENQELECNTGDCYYECR